MFSAVETFEKAPPKFLDESSTTNPDDLCPHGTFRIDGYAILRILRTNFFFYIINILSVK